MLPVFSRYYMMFDYSLLQYLGYTILKTDFDFFMEKDKSYKYMNYVINKKLLIEKFYSDM